MNTYIVTLNIDGELESFRIDSEGYLQTDKTINFYNSKCSSDPIYTININNLVSIRNSTKTKMTIEGDERYIQLKQD